MRHTCVYVFLMITGIAWGQSDTLQLKEVTVLGAPMSRYSAGTKLLQLHLDNDNSLLNKTLADENIAYFKSYGNYQLSTIAFRGTSASHTAVLWNGVNINSPTLGQTDFSLLPVFLMEDIAVQYGTASSQYGTDALGGSIILSQASPRYQKGVRLQVQQENGSFGRNFSGLKLAGSNGKIEFRTKAFFSSIGNNFPYRSPDVGYSKKQNNASVSTQGVDQQVHISLNDRQQLSIEGLYVNNFRNIQPATTNNQADGTLNDKNLRTAISYKNQMEKSSLFVTAAYLWGKETYNVSDITRSSQLNLLASVERTFGASTNIRYGLQAARFQANTGNYNGTIHEERYDGFFSAAQKFGNRLDLSANLRQSWYAAKYAPFAPSLGAQYTLIKNPIGNLQFKAQASRGYRIPTLNDRYWIPGGNPNLKPEDARHFESGLNWRRATAVNEFKADVTCFKTWTNQWIIWLPGSSGLWSPSNLQRVVADGLETSFSYSRRNVAWPFQIGARYSFTQSTNVKGLNEFDRTTEGKQLPYVPYHLASAFFKIGFRSWSVQTRSNYSSLRYTNLDNSLNQSLAPYALLDVSITKTVQLRQAGLIFQIDANNILNTYYETMASHAMPGRNYAARLIINLKTNTQP